jgi:release factor glutamine methyltransferase
MNKKGISYISIFIWISLILFALLLEKGVTTYIANILDLNTEFIRNQDGQEIFKEKKFLEIALTTILFVLLLLFVARYLILSPYRIYSRLWGNTVESTQVLSDEIVFSRYTEVKTFDIVISSIYFLIEFFLSYLLILSIGNYHITLILLILFPLIDFLLVFILTIIYLLFYTISIIVIFFQEGTKHIKVGLKQKGKQWLTRFWSFIAEEWSAIAKYWLPNLMDFLSVFLSVSIVCAIFAIRKCPEDSTIFEYLWLDITTVENKHLESSIFYGLLIGLFLSNSINLPINRQKYISAFDILQRTRSLSKRIKINRLSRRLIGRKIHKQLNLDIELNIFLKRYSEFEPLPYIIGSMDFYGLNLKIDRRCYIPNVETEILVTYTINYIRENITSGSAIIYDIGTGCGNIAISIAEELKDEIKLKIVAIDIDQHCLELAKYNINNYGLSNIIDVKHSDLVTTETLCPDLIVSDLPYGSMRTLLNSLNQDELKHYPPISLHADSSLGEYIRLINQITEKSWDTTLIIETGLVPDVEIKNSIIHSDNIIKQIKRYHEDDNYSITKIEFK